MQVHQTDILDFPADALLLTIDGAAPGMEGNLARQFARRWDEDWGDMQRALRYPVPLGRTIALPWEGEAPWRLYLFASTLHHTGILDESEKLAVARAALAEALKLCSRHGARSRASPLLTGGWRISPERALAVMTDMSVQNLARACGITLQVFDRSGRANTATATTSLG